MDITDGDFARASVQLSDTLYNSTAITSNNTFEIWIANDSVVVNWNNGILDGSTVKVFLLYDSSNFDESTDITLTNDVNGKIWNVIAGLGDISNLGTATINTNDIQMRLGHELSIYHNGVFDNNNFTSLTGAMDSTSDAWIGGQPGGSEFFNGSIDEVRIYNRALDASEISDLSSN